MASGKSIYKAAKSKSKVFPVFPFTKATLESIPTPASYYFRITL